MRKLLPFIAVLIFAAACAPEPGFTHGAVGRVTEAYDAAGFELAAPAVDGDFVDGDFIVERQSQVMNNFAEAEPASPTITQTAASPERIARIIRRAYVSISAPTEDFDTAAQRLNELAPERGGFIESSNFTNHTRHTGGEIRRTLEIVLRVPTERFAETLRYVEELAEVRHSNQTAEDITERFYDTAVRMASRRAEEARLLDLIGEAANLEELLMLEDRLGDVRTQIEVYQAQINNMDRQASLSTIAVTLMEELDEDEEEILPATFGERIGGAFSGSVSATGMILQGLVILAVWAAIPLAIMGLLTIVVILIVKRIIKYVSKPPVKGVPGEPHAKS